MGWSPPPSIADIPQYAIPTNGGTTVISPGVTLLFMDAAGTVATHTITFPTGAVNGQKLIIATASQLSTTTLNGATVRGGVANLPANSFAHYSFSSNANAWFRTG